MPMLINHIDKIARDKQRDVLFLIFYEDQNQTVDSEEDIARLMKRYDYESNETRKMVLTWFENNGIATYPCAPFASGSLMGGYDGRLYIDVPFDKAHPDYQKVENFLENEDGTGKIPGVRFCYLPLESAMKNAHHDEPGYWENLNY
ncbi:MAG: hypothetical protein IPL99_08335 [Candidatus Competibacteraceae bacterium]|nr:hypothetical protein [Candidatus Competibacteraceae bacterium]